MEELSDALAELLTDEEKRKRLGEAAYREAARAHARRTHDAQTNYERLVEIYTEIMSS